MKKAPKKVPLNLLGPDAVLAERLRTHFTKKMGKVSAVSVARMAYRLLADKEGVA